MQQEGDAAFMSLSTTSLYAREGWEYTLGYAASWTRHILAGVEAVRLLHDNGLGLQAAPLRRSLIEHAICVWAVADDHEAFDSYIRGFKWSTERFKLSLENVGLLPTEDMETILKWTTDESTRSLDKYLPSKHRFEQMGEGGRRVHVQWLAETQLSHAGFATAAIYLSNTEDSDYPTLSLDPMVHSSDLIADLICAETIAMALDCLSAILVDDPLRVVVDELNARRDHILDLL